MGEDGWTMRTIRTADISKRMLTSSDKTWDNVMERLLAMDKISNTSSIDVTYNRKREPDQRRIRQELLESEHESPSPSPPRKRRCYETTSVSVSTQTSVRLTLNKRPSSTSAISMKYERKVGQSLRLQVASSQRWKCNICKIIVDESFNIDHIFPLENGGSNARENLQMLCCACHGKKTANERVQRYNPESTIRAPLFIPSNEDNEGRRQRVKRSSWSSDEDEAEETARYFQRIAATGFDY